MNPSERSSGCAADPARATPTGAVVQRTFRIFALGLVTSALAVPLAAAEWALTGVLGAHDPTIIKDGGRWWCFATGRGMRIKDSIDGVAWHQRGPLFETELSWWRADAPHMRPLDVWAPDLQRFGEGEEVRTKVSVVVPRGRDRVHVDLIELGGRPKVAEPDDVAALLSEDG